MGPFGDCKCVIKWEVELVDGTEVFSFGPNGNDPVCSVSSISVKGGTTQNTYNFASPVSCANGLVSPDNASGDPAAVSHVDFCGISCCVPLTCQTAGGTVACGTAVNDQCSRTIDCTCPDDNNGCTTETCSQPTPGAAGTCSSTNVTCTPPNGCKEDCVCRSLGPNSHACDCDDVICEPQNECEENCVCVSMGPTAHTCSCDDACACDESCTLGFYVQNQCFGVEGVGWPVPTDTKFACNESLTLAQALACRGSRGSCTTLQAQQAAALLNLAAFGCIDGEDLDTVAEICASTSTADLKAVNEHDPKCCADDSCAEGVLCPIGRTCPLVACESVK